MEAKDNKMKIGYVGLGKMGKNMVLRLLEQGIEIVAWNRSPEPLNEVVDKGAIRANALTDIPPLLDGRRIIWLMLPAGPLIDEKIAELLPFLSSGDLLIDGGNSFYKDSIRRAEMLKKHEIQYMDVGVSGGPNGARNGASLMVGGTRADYEAVLPLLQAAAAPDAIAYVGTAGAGHFVKMVHNGIEYGMMESIAEGAAVLKQSNFKFDLAEVFRIYNNKTVIESRLVGWAKDAFQDNPNLDGITSVIGHTGEGAWTIETANELKVDVPIIRQSLQVRIDSDKTPENFRNKVISILRNKFGHHNATER